LEQQGAAMKTRKVWLALALVGLIGVAGWYGWRRYTTPPVPTIALAGVSKEKVKKIEGALEAVHRDQRSGKAWGQLGLTLLANGFQNESRQCFANAERFDPTEPRWPYFQGTVALVYGHQEGFPKLRKALELAHTPWQRKAVLFALIRALVEVAEFDEAEQRTQELRSLENGGPEIDYALGIIAAGRNDRARARTYLEHLTEHPSARKRVCALLAGLIDDEQSAREYKRRAQELPNDRPWPDSFESEVPPYSVIEPQPLAPYFELRAQGRQDEAIAMLQEIVQRSPDDVSCNTLGFDLFAANRFEESARAFRQAIGFKRQNAKSHLFLGAALLQMGEARLRDNDTQKAMDLFREVIVVEDESLRLQNDLADAHLTRARALKHLGRADEAIASFRQAVLVGPEYAEMHQALGEALAETGQIREGLEHLEDAVKIAKPGDKRPQEALDKWKARAQTSKRPK
jgi:tetratricopeptide (TPR) repeat protein